MAARKKKGARSAGRKVQRSKAGAVGPKRKPPRKESGGGTKTRGGVARPRRDRSPSIARRLIELVEHAAAGTLRLMADAGGRELAGWLPEAPELRREAGAYVRELRELAGLTVTELAEAVEVSDRSLLEAVEAGTATLSFDLILRMAAILARHDPMPFILRMARSYNPVLWQLLEDWGAEGLPVQLEREHAFVNVLRGSDEARELDDEAFERVLAFTRAAFEMALAFAGREAPKRRKARA